jgi:hypothetical protein
MNNGEFAFNFKMIVIIGTAILLFSLLVYIQLRIMDVSVVLGWITSPFLFLSLLLIMKRLWPDL